MYCAKYCYRVKCRALRGWKSVDRIPILEEGIARQDLETQEELVSLVKGGECQVGEHRGPKVLRHVSKTPRGPETRETSE